MFLQVYKTTLKNLVRSKTFWLILCVLLIISIYSAISGWYGGSDLTDDYVLLFQKYVQTVPNSGVSILMYPLPLFAVITVSLILSRDYGDDFFEIEKANGIKTISYLSGRIIALITINFVVLLFTHLLIININVFTRGGVEDWSIWTSLTDSFVRVLRFDICVALPTVIFYIGMTYALGTIFKNSIIPTVFSLGYVSFFYCSFLLFRNQLAEDYFNSFSPMPLNLRKYFHFYDTEWFDDYILKNDLSVEKVLFCIAFLIGIAVLCSVISYLRIRKRSV